MAFTVLYVDDSVEDRVLMQEIMSEIAPDIQLILAETGQDGIDAAADKRPDLVLLDLNMPGLNGFDVLKQLKKNETLQTLPVIVFTVSTASTHINEAFRNGANAVINKPLTLDEYR
ncbi:MAG: response regulator, partial [Flavobacteriales bacterium]|nr:response regulator [Flavobacteriales bacterium]